MSQVDLYMFPCPLCSKSATEQVDEMYNYLKNNQVMYNTMWLDIEVSTITLTYRCLLHSI